MRLLDLSGSGGGAESGISSELSGRRARSAARGAGAPGRRRAGSLRPGRAGEARSERLGTYAKVSAASRAVTPTAAKVLITTGQQSGRW